MAFVPGAIHVRALLASTNPEASASDLMRAALIGQVSAVRVLAEKGVDVNARDQNGRTALMEAAFAGHTETVKALLERRADVNAKDESGWTALMEAASKGHTESVKILLEFGADINAKSLTGWTALKAGRKHTLLVKLLKHAGAR